MRVLDLSVFLGGLVAATWVVRRTARHLAIRAYMRRTGTTSAPRPTFLPEGFLGLTQLRRLVAAINAGTFNQLIRSVYDRMGVLTFQAYMGVFTIDVENIRHTLYNMDDWIVGPRTNGWAPALSKGIFVTDGKEWEHSRILLRPSFKRSQISQLGNIEHHVQSSIVASVPADGSTVDLRPCFYDLTIKASLDMVFGDYDTTSSESKAAFDRSFTAVGEAISDRTRWGRLYPFVFPKKNRAYLAACKDIHGHLDQLIAQAVRARQGEKGETVKSARYCLLDELLQATDDLEQIRWEIMSLLAAGRDTTATFLGHLLHNLVRQPKVWAKLLEEVEPLGGEAPDYEELQRMKYLKNVVYETLRLWPSVYANARFAARDTYIPHGGGPDGKSPVFVPKGHRVITSIWVLHRRKDVWGPDADEFRPERWADEKLRPGIAYHPFGAGPRVCLGQQTSLATASYALVRLLQACPDLENRDPRPYVEELHVTADVKNGVLVGRKRN